MAEDDIYESKQKYERYIAKLDDIATPRPWRAEKRGAAKYYCKNPVNIRHFRRLLPLFDARDLSYIRRLRLFRTLIMACHATSRDLAECDREEINRIVGFAHSVYPAAKSKRDFIIDLKFMWRVLFPDLDEKGRPDETLMPYAVRHLSAKIDRSKEKLRDEKMTYEDFERLIQSFSLDKRLQAYLALSLESLRRPQELLYTRIRDVEIHDSHAKIWIASHGKEGPGLAQCIDSFPYLVAWFNEHPLRHNPDAYLFINIGCAGRYEQLKPTTINKHLRMKLKVLGIQKRITCYSFKRNGVTLRRLRGDSDVSIQRAAGWTSTRQLQTYDLSTAEDAYSIELVKRGLISDARFEQFKPSSKTCGVCAHVNGLAEAICAKCKRPLDRKKIEEEAIAQNGKLSEERQAREEMEGKLESMERDYKEMNALMNKLVQANPQLIELLAQSAKKAA
jgi:integrase